MICFLFRKKMQSPMTLRDVRNLRAFVNPNQKFIHFVCVNIITMHRRLLLILPPSLN